MSTSSMLPAVADTVVKHTPDGAPFVICRSSKPFVNPTTDSDDNDSNNNTHSSSDPEQVNQQLNLDLGLTGIARRLFTRENKVLLWLIRTVENVFFLHWWERFFLDAWSHLVPIAIKRTIIQYAWKYWFAWHKWAFGKSTGLHPSQSLEYHAMTTLLYGSNFLSWTPQRIRFALRELYSTAPNDPPSPDRIRVIEHTMDTISMPVAQAKYKTVNGWYIHRHEKKSPTAASSRGIIFWIYGGAYLGGDVRGNASTADYVGEQTEMDVFLPSFRLAPEANLFDVLWDICLAYYWLLLSAEQEQTPPTKIFVLGISSGAALATRLLQLIAHFQRGEELHVPAYFEPLLRRLTKMPDGGILLAPYVDYEQLHEHERKGSFLHYAQHDLVVNRAVQEYGLPYLEDFMPGLQKGEDNLTARRRQSPINRSLKGLPPLFVLASEHEAVFDMTMTLANRARSEGVSVTLLVMKYLCHVFTMMHGFVPEGEIAMNVMVDWIKEQQQQK